MASQSKAYILPPPTVAAIGQLRAAGIEPEPQDVVTLYEVGKRLLRPAGIDAGVMLNTPARAGSVRLYPLTIGAQIWLADEAMPVVEHDNELVLYATAYACACAREPRLLSDATLAGICKTVSGWARCLDCTLDELLDAMQLVMPRGSIVDDIISKHATEKKTIHEQLDDARGDTTADGYGPVITLLCREFGQSPEYWLFSISHDEALYYVGQLVDRMMREHGEKAGMVAPVMRAQRAMILAVNDIKRRHKESLANGE